MLDKKKCTGCAACVNICPCDAVGLKKVKYGFMYPIIDTEKCINCRKCVDICPVEQDKKNSDVKAVYALKSKNEDIRFSSTSGGAFTELAQIILRQKGCVVGAAYKKDWTVEHQMVEYVQDLEKLRRSKYQQSEINYIFRSIKEKLLEKRKVLFCGTPCQVAGLKAYLQKEYENLYTCDFICRGVSSPLLFQHYLQDLKQVYKGEIISVWMKNKRYSWHSLSTVIEFDNGKEYEKIGLEDSYVQLFLKYNVGVRESCYDCHFKGNNNKSDITLGDFWGMDKTEFDDDKGISVLICRTEKGQELIPFVMDNCIICQKELEDVKKANPCLESSLEPSVINNEKFFVILEKKGYQNTLNDMRDKYDC